MGPLVELVAAVEAAAAAVQEHQQASEGGIGQDQEGIQDQEEDTSPVVLHMACWGTRPVQEGRGAGGSAVHKAGKSPVGIAAVGDNQGAAGHPEVAEGGDQVLQLRHRELDQDGGGARSAWTRVSNSIQLRKTVMCVRCKEMLIDQSEGRQRKYPHGFCAIRNRSVFTSENCSSFDQLPGHYGRRQ